MVNREELRALIARGESLAVEFKSDRGPLGDADLLGTVVCLANGQGGTLLVGVEDDGTVTGLHPKHQTRPGLLAAFVASRTVPPFTVDVAFVELTEGIVAVLSVPAAHQPAATSDGRLLIRYVDSRGKPGCRPLYPHELSGWRADRGLADVSAMPVSGATWADLDPLELARLRRMVEENRGDAALLELSEQELACALGLVQTEEDRPTPTLAGLLLVGKEAALRDYVPAHEVAFQVLQGSEVVVNEFRHWPLLRTFEWLMQAIGVRNEEQELMIDGFRIGVPRYDRHGIREAVNNALMHRDYGQLGAVHLQLHDDYALATNPGGFVVGVHVDNLLAVAPRPRNPLLADAFKRVGLVERTGRGVGIIYIGQLENGRPPPSYARSTEVSVTVTLGSGPADLDFVESTVRVGKRLGRALAVPELLVLWEIWTAGRVTGPQVRQLIQGDQKAARELLLRLQQDELVAGFSSGGQRLYRLGPEVRCPTGHTVVGPTVVALSPAQIEEQIVAHVRKNGRIQRGEVETLTGLGRDQAYRLLKRLVERGILAPVGRGRAAYYRMSTGTPAHGGG